jgi:mannose-6-phosphate isomerase
MPLDLSQPIKLKPGNFTPLTRTPWAGKKISSLKSSWLDTSQTKIGESWEFSLDTEFPSRATNGDFISDLLKEYPEQILSRPYMEKFGKDVLILIKLLNADLPLSLQIHPEDDDVSLKKNQCGKPESWLVLDADQDSGIFLGFKAPYPLIEIHSAIADGSFDASWLNFVKVEKGDYFEISPGTPHAVGPGLLLLEPQRVLPQKSGVTYRLWDWNRRYDAQGVIDRENGSSRPLDLEQSLLCKKPLIHPGRHSGPDFPKSLQRKPELKVLRSNLVKSYPQNSYCQVHHCQITTDDTLTLNADLGFAVMVVTRGQIFAQDQRFQAGESALIPYDCLPLTLRGGGDGETCFVLPHGASASFS